MKKQIKQIGLAVGLAFAMGSFVATAAPAMAPVLNTYAQIAHQSYADSLADAIKLEQAIKAFAAKPNEATLDAAKKAWLVSRESYGTTEVFRLSNGPIDAEEGWVEKKYGNLEGQINAWPLDENMIDYTIDENGKRTRGNIVDSKGKFKPAGKDAKRVNVSKITPSVLEKLNENGGEANVATGYHAIEFLLWGQDQDYSNFVEDKVTNGAMVAGQRPVSDFTTAPGAKRRLAYLKAAAKLLVDDLTTINQAWEAKGQYRQALTGQLTGKLASRNLKPKWALKDIFIGMGTFIKSELANERIAVAVLTPSEEDEHSCFSDNTHRDIAQNFQGFKNVLMGTVNGKKVGDAPFDALSAEEKAKVQKLIDSIEARINKVDELARTTMHFDYQIQPQNEAESKNIVALKNELRNLGDQMVEVAKAFEISLSVEDVTDEEETKI